VIERGNRQRLPEPRAQFLTLAVRHEPIRDRPARFSRYGALLLQLAAGPPERSRQFDHRQSIAPPNRIPIEHAGEKVQRGRQGRALQHRSTSSAIDIRHRERGLNADVVERADPFEELEGRPITAEQHVLAVARPPS